MKKKKIKQKQKHEEKEQEDQDTQRICVVKLKGQETRKITTTQNKTFKNKME